MGQRDTSRINLQGLYLFRWVWPQIRNLQYKGPEGGRGADGQWVFVWEEM